MVHKQTAELFIEVFSEELPAGMQVKAASDLENLITKGLKDAGLSFETSQSHATPRRLAVVVEGVETVQEDRIEEKKGPKTGAPEQALAGFMKANGLSSIEEAEQRETPKGVFYFAVRTVTGRATAGILPALVEGAITALSWPKSMRWGHGTFRWARPVHSVIALFDGQLIDGKLPLSSQSGSSPSGPALAFGNTTSGHRFMGPNPIKVSDFANYRRKLADQKVILDRLERKAVITRGLAKLAAEKNLIPIEDAGLLEEITGLVEWPVPLAGRIDDEFMTVPAEVLVASMREHQKFFAFKDRETGALAPFFATVANTVPHDDGTLIRAGNERVLRARLSDAKFFWDLDRKTPLASNVPALSNIVFHAKLGTVGDKIDRMGPLASYIADAIGADKDKTRSAVRLCKADLVSSMVYEFPELQGTMGRYYALNDAESAEVGDAIAGHYSPLGPKDACPKAPVTVAVALADKLDTLAGFWLIDEKPTGSKDPFALRRAALGVTRLISENGHRLGLKDLLTRATQAYTDQAYADLKGKDVIPALWAFFQDRLKVRLKDEGVRHDVIDALYAAGDDDDLTRLFAKAKSLAAALETEDGRAMVAGYKRACNLLAAEEKKSAKSSGGKVTGGHAIGGKVDVSLLSHEAETGLNAAMETALSAAKMHLGRDEFTRAYAAVAGLRPAIDSFFDHVTVNAQTPEIRENRLALLATLRAAVQSVADLSRLEG